MAVAFGSIRADEVASATTWTLILPTGVAVGDVLIAYLASDRNTTTTISSAPAGWATIPGTTNPTQDLAAIDCLGFFYWKRLQAGDAELSGTNPAWTWASASAGIGLITRYTGSSGIDTGASVGTASGTSHVMTAITPSVDNCMIVAGMHVDKSATTSAGVYYTPPASWTERIDMEGATLFVEITSADFLQGAAATIGGTFTGADADGGVTWICALAPAAVDIPSRTPRVFYPFGHPSWKPQPIRSFALTEPAAVSPGFIYPHIEPARRNVAQTARGRFLVVPPDQVAAPQAPDFIEPFISRRRQSISVRRVGDYFQVPTAPSYVPALTRQPRRQAPIRRTGRFFPLGSQPLSVPSYIDPARRVATARIRRGAIFPVLSVVVTTPPTYPPQWISHRITPTRYRRDGQFLPFVPDQVQAQPTVWNPTFLRALPRRFIPIRRQGQIFLYPWVGQQVVAAVTLPQFITRRRPSSVSRRGDYFTLTIQPSIVPSTLESRRPPQPLKRRGRFYGTVPLLTCPAGFTVTRRAKTSMRRRGQLFAHPLFVAPLPGPQAWVPPIMRKSTRPGSYRYSRDRRKSPSIVEFVPQPPTAPTNPAVLSGVDRFRDTSTGVDTKAADADGRIILDGQLGGIDRRAGELD